MKFRTSRITHIQKFWHIQEKTVSLTIKKHTKIKKKETAYV